MLVTTSICFTKLVITTGPNYKLAKITAERLQYRLCCGSLCSVYVAYSINHKEQLCDPSLERQKGNNHYHMGHINTDICFSGE